MKVKGYIIISFILFFFGILVGTYIFYKPVEKLVKKKHQIEISANELFRIYENKESEGNERFLNKVILVNGKIISISDKIIVIGENGKSVSCKLDELELAKIQMYSIGQEIKIKGLCSGMGLFDVNLTKCIIID